MKKILSTFIIFLLAMHVMAQQEAQEQVSSCGSYLRITAGFNGLHMYSDGGDTKFDTDMFAPGGTVGFSYGVNLSGKDAGRCALYAETGAEVAYNSGSHIADDGRKDWVETRLDLMSVTIPLDLSYKIHLNDDNDYFVIYGGFSPKVNISADMKYQTAKGKSDHSVNMFSKDDMGDGFTAERFQFGLNAGAGLELGNVTLYYRFCFDTIPFQSYSYGRNEISTHTMSHNVSLSYIFRN